MIEGEFPAAREYPVTREHFAEPRVLLYGDCALAVVSIELSVLPLPAAVAIAVTVRLPRYSFRYVVRV